MVLTLDEVTSKDIKLFVNFLHTQTLQTFSQPLVIGSNKQLSSALKAEIIEAYKAVAGYKKSGGKTFN